MPAPARIITPSLLPRQTPQRLADLKVVRRTWFGNSLPPSGRSWATVPETCEERWIVQIFAGPHCNQGFRGPPLFGSSNCERSGQLGFSGLVFVRNPQLTVTLPVARS